MTRWDGCERSSAALFEAEVALEGAGSAVRYEMQPELVPAFLRRAVTSWTQEPQALPPVVVWDADGFEPNAWYDHRDDTIHLAPRAVHPLLVLHELAHALRPGESHGSQWAATVVCLAALTLGQQAKEAVEEAFADEGLLVDPAWT